MELEDHGVELREEKVELLVELEQEEEEGVEEDQQVEDQVAHMEVEEDHRKD